jgi:hypothetical protein
VPFSTPEEPRLRSEQDLVAARETREPIDEDVGFPVAPPHASPVCPLEPLDPYLECSR